LLITKFQAVFFSEQVYTSGQTQQGDYLSVGTSAGICLPSCMKVEISVPSTGSVTQTFELDSACNGGQGLILSNDYGGFESIGYSCSSSDTHNCIQEIEYVLDVCNKGIEDEQLYEWALTLDNVETDLLEEKPTSLLTDICFDYLLVENVDRCNAFESSAEVSANATNPATGLPPGCWASEGINFGWEQPETPPPTPPPTPSPTPAPSPSPTSTCIIDVSLNGCPRYNSTLENSCEGRPQVITFRYLGGNCEQSNNFQNRQKFSCTDLEGGPPTASGTPSFIKAFATKDGENGDVYFQGNVDVGEKYTLNENLSYDKLAADMTILIYDSEGGTLLQQTDLHLSCSQALFLFDKFGASQVTEWIETDGRVVSDKQLEVPTGKIELQLDATSGIATSIRLLEMIVITNALDFPVNYTSQVNGVILEPGVPIELEGFDIDIELTRRTRYTFFTTIIGESLDGKAQCNGLDYLECTIGFNLDPIFPTLMPTPRPTITQYPTTDPEFNACEVSADIRCSVTSLPGISCDELVAPVSASCPEGAQLMNTYLKYDGSLGDSIFLEAVCDKSNTFIDKFIRAGETFSFRPRANVCTEVTFIISTSDPLIDGTQLSETIVPTSCPGPWTLGGTIAEVFSIDAFIDTLDDSVTFEIRIDEVEIQLDYVVENNGQFPLTVESGEIANSITSSDGTAISSSNTLDGLPIAMAPRSQQVLQSTTEVVKISGRAGDEIEYLFNIVAETTNQFALPCVDDTSRNFRL
jgi:hypothetical protein